MPVQERHGFIGNASFEMQADNIKIVTTGHLFSSSDPQISTTISSLKKCGP